MIVCPPCLLDYLRFLFAVSHHAAGVGARMIRATDTAGVLVRVQDKARAVQIKKKGHRYRRPLSLVAF